MTSALRGVPTDLTDADLLGFAPLGVVTVAELRRARAGRLRSLAVVGAAAAAAVALYRGYQQARHHLDELDAQTTPSAPS